MHATTVRRRGASGAALALTVAVALTLAACGAEGDDEAASTTAATSTTTSTTSTTAPDDEGEDDEESEDEGEGGATADLACPDGADVADLVGQPVDETSSSGGSGSTDGPSFSYTGCGYRLEDEGDIRVQRITIDDPGPFEGLPFEVLEAHAQAEAAEAELEEADPPGPDEDPVTYEGVSIGELAAFDTGSALVVHDDTEHPLRITTDDLPLDPAEAAALRLALAELVISG